MLSTTSEKPSEESVNAQGRDRAIDDYVASIPNATDWYPNALQDPGNPQNWSSASKVFQTFIPICVGLLAPFGSSVYTPGLEQVMDDFGISREVALLPFVFYLLGLSFGPVIAAPVSETYGRRIVYLSALPVFAAFTIGAGFSSNITSLVVCRFFAGLVASPGLAIGSGSTADLYRPHKRAVPMAVFVTSVQMGPVLGPLIGGFVTEKRNWRWTQWVILFGIAIVLTISLGAKETYKTTILKSRAKRLGIEGPAEPQRTPMESFKYFAKKTIVRPLHMTATEPMVLFWNLYTAFLFGLLNAFFAAFSYVFRTTYGFGLGSIGLTYLGQAVGSLAGLAITLFIFEVIWTKEHAKLREADPQAKFPPERKLILAKVGAPLLPVSLFWFGWTARPSVHWLAPVAAEALFSCANLLIFTCALMALQDCYGSQYGASAASSNTFARYLAAFAFPLFAVQMFEGLGNGWAASLLGFVSLLLLPIPFVFERYGERIRAKSQYRPDE
ncbi:Polyamine transporter 4 [Fulvia fulva]|nr:Polyamine transporter 4 [Fulvia fulva]KAK4620889.1 Polyamine transporter 4 [Fulvia fulva]WPV17756.1 Polyamine transporter 4 [Fulvia fulva]WPV31795.1 Polyamine transporter 4 [Fulvia fulva]